MPATRNQINSNFYQLVNTDANGNITAIQSQFLSNVTIANANYSNFAGSATTVNGWIKVPFNYNDATPKLLAVIPANAVVASVDIIIITPFANDATLKVGTIANPDELQLTLDNFPYEVGTYTTIPGKIYLSETHVLLTISPGSSSTGNGMLIIKF